MKTILITGGAGFIGHYLVKKFVKDYKIICLVRPSTNFDRLEDVKEQVEFIEHDIKLNHDHLLEKLKDVGIILHAGANPSSESSIKDPVAVVMDNVVGTVNLLELARKLNIEKFVYYSAAEVFGPIKPNTHSGEDDRYNSNSPYAASKAGGEEMCLAYSNTFGVPVSIIHITNTFGERCQSNRFPVIAIRRILNDQPIDIHIGSDKAIGGRRWFHAADVAEHTEFILANQKTLCEKWNSAGSKFISNLEFAEIVAKSLNKELKVNYIPVDRPGHDSYFSVTPSKLYKHGWKESISTRQKLRNTVAWYQNNQSWLGK